MKAALSFLILIFFFSSFNLFSIPYDMILADDPVLDDLRFLSVESGNSILSFTPPFAPHEIQTFLNSLDASLLSPAALQAYYRLEKRLNPTAPINISGDFFTFFLNINSTLETRTRFNSEISWHPQNTKTPAVLSFPLRFFFSDSVTLYLEPMYAMDPEDYKKLDYFGVNIPIDSYYPCDLNIPLRAFLAVGGPFWNFQIGRDRLSYGTGQNGNLAIMDNPDYHDFMRLSLFSKFFKYSFLVSHLPLALSDDIVPSNVNIGDNDLKRTTQRYLYLHRIDISFFNKVSFGIMEGALIGNSSPELRFLNPMSVYHSFFSWWNYDDWQENYDHMVGSLLSFEVNWNILDSLAFYCQFIMNDFATEHELSISPEGQPPNALGYMAGLRYAHSFNSWGSLFYVEFFYTDPYLHILASPFASYIHMRYLAWAPDRYYYNYIGYPRDTIAIYAGADFFKNDIIKLSALFSWILSGQHNKDGVKWDFEYGPPYNREKTPWGIVENKYILSFAAQWKIYSYITIKGDISGIYSLNNAYINNEKAFGGQFGLSVNFYY
ncbi:capsule assembly Wzi family protein [Treponema sp. R80B11-R83G3]